MLRRTRTHLHGASNRPHSQLSRTSHLLSSSKHTLAPQHQVTQANSNPFSSFACRRKHQKLNFNASQADQQEQSQAYVCDNIERKLRKKYKNAKNIVKMVDHWGIDARGYLTRQQFRLKTEKAIGREATEAEIDQLMLRHSESADHIDASGLVTLLCGQSNGIPIDTIKMPPQQNSPNRQALVDNLKEDIKKYKPAQRSQLTGDVINTLVAKINTGISKMRHQSNSGALPRDRDQFFSSISQIVSFNNFQKKMIQQIKQGVNFDQVHQLVQSHKNSDYLLVDPILRKNRGFNKQLLPQGFQNSKDQIFIGKMKSLPNLFDQSLSLWQKRAPFDPVNLLNINQRKTRFQGSGFTQQTTGWVASTSSQAVQKDQKEKVLQSLREEAEIKQIRYQNKLKNMRMNRQKQRENVNIRQQLAQEREKSRVDRYRDQQQAYNYINFIKKRWD